MYGPFLSTLSLRRATRGRERPSKARYLFLSTLSLRRATDDGRDSLIERMISIHALLAESDVSGNYNQTVNGISIHALLAESDLKFTRLFYDLFISIHALLAESDCWCWEPGTVTARFLSTLSLRRAT